MSSISTRIKNKKALVKALERMNSSWKGKIEVHEKAVNLIGFQGDTRDQTAEVVIRRNYISGSSNDMGFKLQADGTYQAIISDYDASKHNGAWTDKLQQCYSSEVIKEVAAESGFSFEEREENGELFVECHTGF